MPVGGPLQKRVDPFPEGRRGNPSSVSDTQPSLSSNGGSTMPQPITSEPTTAAPLHITFSRRVQ